MDALLVWGMALVALSLILLAVEVLVPSAGMIGTVALVLAIVGLVLLFKTDWRWGISGILVVLVLGPGVVYFAFQVFPSTPLGRKIINAEPAIPDEQSPPAPPGAELLELVDAEGEAVTDLRPGGFVRIEGKRLAAMSEVAFIGAGQRVRVTGADSMQVRVRPAGRSVG